MPIGRFLGMWVLMAVAMSMNGIGRELFLKRVLPPSAAAVVSALLGIALIGLISRWGFAAIAEQSSSTTTLWQYSVALVVLTVLFETVLGRVVDHKSWSELAEHYAFWRGEWWPIVLAWLAMTPFVWARGWLSR
jgi:xanthine/uracil permease